MFHSRYKAQAGPKRRRHVHTASSESWLIAVLGSALIECFALLASPPTRHWFLIPLFFNGVLCGVDVVEWIRRRMNLLDPVGIVGVLAAHWFFLSPILHVAWDHMMPYSEQPPDWRPWLGRMAVLNCLGLLIYRRTRIFLLERWGDSPFHSTWTVNIKRAYPTLCALLAVAVAVQVAMYSRFGGVAGLAETRMTALLKHTDDFANSGWFFAVGESAPILMMFTVAVYFRIRKRKPAWPTIVALILVLFVMLFYFGGLRGSRSTVLEALFWGVCVLHLWIRPLPRSAIFAGLAVAVIFMFVYNTYKHGGTRGVELALDSSVSTDSTSSRSQMEIILLDDLSREDIQAYEIYRLSVSDYEYGFGRTYVGAVASMIPKAFWPNRPDGKNKEGTEILEGVGTYIPLVHTSSRVYGLAGEAVLNFGPYAVPLSFAVMAFVVALVRRFLIHLPSFDTRRLIVPFLLYMCLTAIVGDSDNLMYGLGKEGLVPALAVFLVSDRRRQRGAVMGRRLAPTVALLVTPVVRSVASGTPINTAEEIR